MNRLSRRITVSVLLVLALALVACAQPKSAAASLGTSGTIVDRRPLQLSANVAPPAAELQKRVHMEAITYISDGLRIKGYLAVPEGSGTFPCVILNRGGNQDLSVWTDDRALQSLGKLASWGYVVVASQYRAAGGSEGKDEYGGADVDDVLNLLPLLKTVPVADSSRIGMFGVSRGGMMTYLALTRTDQVKAAVIVSGLSDLSEMLQSRPEMGQVFNRLIPDFASQKDAALRQRSAIHWVNKLPANVPLLLIHGTADWRVSPSQAFDMARALYEAKHPVRFAMFEGGAHGVPEFLPERDILVRQWLDNYVRDGKKWPDLSPHGE